MRMRPNIAVAPAPDSGSGRAGGWYSPIPYIFSGIGLMLLVVASALMLLACSYVKSFQSEDDNWQKGLEPFRIQQEMEPQLVVIMAGETRPTHLAKPLAILSNSTSSIN